MSYPLIYFHRLHFPSESGQTLQVLRDYHAMASLGEAVHLLYRASVPFSPDELDAVLADYDLVRTPSFFLHGVGSGFLGSRRNLTRTVCRLLEAEGPGRNPVLIVRTIDHAREALALRDARHRGAVRVCLELHETALPHLVYSEEGRRWRSRWSLRREREVFRRVDGIICTVPSQVVILDRLFPRHAPVVVLPNGVMLSAFASLSEQTPHRTDGRFRLCYAGQLTPWKNPLVMVEALRYLPDRVVLDIAGGKTVREAQIREELVAYARSVGVAGRVNYVGYLLPKRIPKFLSEADGLVLPLGENVRSQYFTCPMKLFEYAASGVPMIVTRQPSTLSLIEHGVQAIMVPPNSAGELADAVRRLLADADLGRRLAANARKWVAQYDYGTRAVRYREFVTQTIHPQA